MRYSGLAIGDAVGLERSKIELDAPKKFTRIVTSRAKTGVDISVPIPADAAKELLSVANGEPRYIFWQTGNGEPQSAVKNWHKDLRVLSESRNAGRASSPATGYCSRRMAQCRHPT